MDACMSRRKQQPFAQVGSLGWETMQYVVHYIRLYTWTRMLGQLYYTLRGRAVRDADPGVWLRTNVELRLREARSSHAKR